VKTALACSVLVGLGSIAWAARTSSPPAPIAETRSPEKRALGERLFFDASLSEPPGQSCATCHDPQHAFADPRGKSTSEGAVKGRFGRRNAPSITYASFAPPLGTAGDEGYAGGQFWDGRVNTLAEQVKGPLLNPLEMNNADEAMILRKIRAAYGDQLSLADVGDAIAAYEAELPHRFSSKYDAFLAGNAKLTDSEARGLRLFEHKKTGPCTPNRDGTSSPPCGCAQCHLDRPSADGSPPLFTDFGFDNIGIPHDAVTNPDPVDEGLGVMSHNWLRVGQFKSPSLRNVAITAPYGHNGYFKTLKEVVDFYNTRDVQGAWPPPEQPRGMNHLAIGNLKLTDNEEDDLVAFLETLTDGYSTP
jgi:cytochrome c peroxidase